jgi:hypothetical protein
MAAHVAAPAGPAGAGAPPVGGVERADLAERQRVGPDARPPARGIDPADGYDVPDRSAPPAPLVSAADVPAPAEPRRRSRAPLLAAAGLAVAATVYLVARPAPPAPGEQAAATPGTAGPPVGAPAPVPDVPAVTPEQQVPAGAPVADTASPAYRDSVARVVEAARLDSARIAIERRKADSARAVADAEAGTAVGIKILGFAPGQSITLYAGDSTRMVSQVVNSAGKRLEKATVTWSSSDPSRAAHRRPYAYGVAPGGPVTITARSGAGGRLAASVRVTVLARPDTARQRPSAAASLPEPTREEIRAAFDDVIAALRGQNPDEIVRRLGPTAADGSSTREFAEWVRGLKGFGVVSPTPGRPGADGERRSVGVSAQLRYTRGGLIKSVGYANAVFNIGLRHTPEGWRPYTFQLARRVDTR